MRLFPAPVHKGEGSAFGVTRSDVPGGFAATDDADSLIENAAWALALWFEEQAPVEPRALEAMCDEVAGDRREGAFLVIEPWSGRGRRSA